MRILELTDFSAGTCGVWTRVKQESEMLSKLGHSVKVLSSNFTKGSDKIALEKEKLGEIDIRRFSALMPGKKPLHYIPGGESYIFWDFRKAMKEAVQFKPNVIIAHSYRHPHTLFALRVAKLTSAKVFLVTHAPFIEGDSTRTFTAAQARKLFDITLGRATLNKFDKIIAITKWEKKYLAKLGVREDKMAYIPNGIPSEFFTQKTSRQEKKILFFGRISPIKDIETLIRAAKMLPKWSIEIAGPAEQAYLKKLRSLNPPKSVIFTPPIYGFKEKIAKIDSASIFILPSKREGMPQALIEAMARKKIVVASDNPGSRELISNGKNGFLFKIGDEKDLAKIINEISIKSEKDLNKIRLAAFNSVKGLDWTKLIKRLEKLLLK